MLFNGWKLVKSDQDTERTHLNRILADIQSTIDALGPGGSGVTTVVAGSNITVDNTDPANPIIAAVIPTPTLDGGIHASAGSFTGAVIPAAFQINGLAAGNYTITGWKMWCYPSSTIDVDVQVSTFGTLPPTGGDSIVASAPPTITAGTSAGGAVTGWTTTVNSGDAITVSVNTNDNATWFVLLLEGTKT